MEQQYISAHFSADGDKIGYALEDNSVKVCCAKTMA